MNIKLFLKQYTWLIVLLAIILALIFPEIWIGLRIYTVYFLMVLMFLGCINIDFARSWKHLKKVRKVIVGLLIIHLISALVILLFKPLFSQEIFLGLILAAIMPAGISVIFLSKLYGGSTAKSLVIAFLSNILSPVTVPFLTYMFAREMVEIDMKSIIWIVLKLVLFPIILALLIGKVKVVNGWLANNGTYVSIVVLFFLILGVVSPVRESLFLDINLTLMLSVLILVLVIINFVLGYWLGSDKKAKITYAISVSYKNFSLATVLALTLFGPMVALPAVIYTLINNLFLVPLQLFFVKEIE